MEGDIKTLQAVGATTTDTPATTSCPTIVISSKATPNIQVTKTSSTGEQQKTPDKGKAKPISKVKKNPMPKQHQIQHKVLLLIYVVN